MIVQIIRIQKEIARLLNRFQSARDSDIFELADFVNRMSPYEVTDVEGKAVVRNKKTLEVIDL